MEDLDFIVAVYMNSVVKAAKVNLVTGEYRFVKVLEEERERGLLALGTMDEYPKKIVENHWIHPDDIWDYLFHMRLSYLRGQIAEGKRRVVHSFRRKMGDKYVWITVSVAIAEDFSEENPWAAYTWREADNDSRAMEDAMYALSTVYHKILKANLTKDSFEAVKLYEEEMKKEWGFSEKLSEWLHNFATSGSVHPDDVEEYLAFSDITALKNIFRKNGGHVNLRYRRRAGSGYRWVTMTILPSVEYSDDNQVVMIYVQDIHDNYIKEQEQRKQLEYYCNYDILTGLHNRYYYNSHCTRYYESERRFPAAAVFADINGLKQVNDDLGHVAGDQYIKKFADILAKTFAEDVCCRISGDEFVVLMENISRAEAQERFAKLRAALDGDRTPIAATGFAWDGAPVTLEELVAAAESGMYENKRECHKKMQAFS